MIYTKQPRPASTRAGFLVHSNMLIAIVWLLKSFRLFGLIVGTAGRGVKGNCMFRVRFFLAADASSVGTEAGTGQGGDLAADLHGHEEGIELSCTHAQGGAEGIQRVMPGVQGVEQA